MSNERFPPAARATRPGRRLAPLLAAAAVLASGLAAAPPARATDLNFSFPLTDYTRWQLFGSATAQVSEPGNGFVYSNLNLTGGTGGEAGAGFAPQAFTLDFTQGWRFSFNFYIPVSTGLRGDGLTFTLSDTAGLGGTGSGLGYEGLSGASIALAIDTFDFGAPDPASPSLQLLAGGSVSPLAATETGLGDAIRDPDWQWFASLEYAPDGVGAATGLLRGTLAHLTLGTFSVQSSVDFEALGMTAGPLYAGFTAANGLASDAHIVTSAQPIPEPGTLALWAAGLAVLLRLNARRH